MVGLIDLDFITAPNDKLPFPNLEIMKLASYYTTELNQFNRLITLNDTDFSNYDVVYCFSENPLPIVPPQFKSISNIVYGGTGFTNGNYVPFENELIEYSLPRTTPYKNILKEKFQYGLKTQQIERFLDNTYYRHYANDKKLPLPRIMARKLVILYDVKFFYTDWRELLEISAERKASSVVRIHPVICHKLSDFFDLRSYPIFSANNDIILDLNIPLDECNYMLNKYTNKFLGTILNSSHIYLPLGGSYKTNMLYFRDLIYKLHLLYCFWSRNIPIKLKYIVPKQGFFNPCEHLEQKIAQWSHTNRKHLVLKERIILKTKRSTEQDELEFILKYFPKEHRLFEQSYEKVRQGGYWRI